MKKKNTLQHHMNFVHFTAHTLVEYKKKISDNPLHDLINLLHLFDSFVEHKFPQIVEWRFDKQMQHEGAAEDHRKFLKVQLKSTTNKGG